MKPHRIQAVLLLSSMIAVALTASDLQVGRESATFCTATGTNAAKVTEVDAASDDSTSDSSQIQAAINAAGRAGGGIVQLSAGQFNIDRPLVLKSNVALRGAGPATVLKATSRLLDSKGPYGGYPLVTTDGADHVTIAHLTADQNGDVLDGNISGRLYEYLIDVRHSTNALVEGVSTRNPYTYSIAVVGSSNFCVRNNSTVVTSSGKYDQLDGIHITDSHSGIVAGNRIDQRQGADGDDGLVAQTIGAPVYDVIYRDNEVRGGSHGSGMQLAVSGYEIYDITVVNNRFWGSPIGVKTGYYDGGSQAVHDVAVRANIFVDTDGASADFFGQLKNIHIVDNFVCRSGEVKVADGTDNVVARNVSSC